jgi:hypothetical protein
MKIRVLIVLCIALTNIGCTRKLRLVRDYGNHIYLQLFKVGSFGVDEAFVTDSANFIIYIGKYDSDHEGIGCKFKGDTITVMKTKDKFYQRIVIDRIELSRDSLTRNKVHSSSPLFEYK